MSVTTLLPVIIDLLHTRGTDLRFEVTLSDPVTSSPVDLTNESVSFTVRLGYTGAKLFSTKTNGIGQHSTPLSGKTRFTVSKADVADTAFEGVVKEYRYEIRRIQASGEENVYFSGKFQLHPTPKP